MNFVLSVPAGLACLLCAGVLLWRSRIAQSRIIDVFSGIINCYLLKCHPIRHVDSGRLLPTCPYRFPNGQGDVGKFLEGVRNREEWGKRNGSIYRIWSGTRAEIVLTRPEHIREVFKDSDKHSKAVNNNSGYLMSQVLGKCIGLISGGEWETVRAAFEHPFVRSAAVEYVPMIRRHVARYFAGLHRTGSLGQGLLDPAEDLKLLPFWIVAEVFYGEITPEMTLELINLAVTREELFKYVIRGGISRFEATKHLPTRSNKLLCEFRARWECFNEMAYQRAKLSNTGAPIVDLYETMIHGTITREQLLQTIDESIFANLDVTTGGISWSLVSAASYQQYQDLLRQEVMAAGDQDEYIRSSTTLLAAFILESSRLNPLAAFSVPQSAPTIRIIDGYAIPPGTDYIVDTYALNVRNEFWGQDAGVFRPERFLEHGRAALRYHFWRFGFGPRQCMGKYLADLIIRVLLAHLVENYELGLLEAGNDWPRNPESWINHPQMKIRCEIKAVE